MSSNADRFLGRVDEYARYRTRYPPAMLHWLRSECGLDPAWAIADVGAGTGMLAELFLANGNAVIAIEPNREMSNECAHLQDRFPRLHVMDGTAEKTGLEARSVDLVSAGRAFHWFEPVAAAPEFRRVLRPGGWLVIASSGRCKEETEQSREFEALLMEHGTDPARVRDRYERRDRIEAFLRSCIGQPRPVDFTEEIILDWTAFLGWVQSMSIAPLRGTPGYEGMQDSLQSFFRRWNVDGALRINVASTLDVAQIG